MRFRLLRAHWAKIVALPALVIAAFAAWLYFTARPAARKQFFAAAPAAAARPSSPLVIAHQGGAGLWPGNTMHAFRGAAELGVDVIEMDLQSTADAQLVLMHDRTVDRTTDGSGAVGALTLDELRKLDAGYDWTPDGGRTFPFRGRGLRVPTLGEVLDAFPDRRLNIEIKGVEPPLVKTFCDELRARRVTDNALVASFGGTAIAEFRAHCPEVATSASTAEVIRFLSLQKISFGDAYTPQAQALQVPARSAAIEVLTADFVGAAHRRGLQVHAWTINDEAEMRRLIGLGLDGVITDFPDRLLAVLGRK